MSGSLGNTIPNMFLLVIILVMFLFICQCMCQWMFDHSHTTLYYLLGLFIFGYKFLLIICLCIKCCWIIQSFLILFVFLGFTEMNRGSCQGFGVFLCFFAGLAYSYICRGKGWVRDLDWIFLALCCLCQVMRELNLALLGAM